jgi:hypothetical protein
MTTLIKPPPVLIKTTHDNNPLFTLHTKPNHVMAWRPPSTTKMAIVSFKREYEVKKFAHMIENHYDIENEWPDFSELRFISNKNFKKELHTVGVFEWSNQDTLRDFCAHHYFDLIVVKSISNKKINGNIYTFSVPEQYHIPYLNQLYLKTEQPPEN